MNKHKYFIRLKKLNQVVEFEITKGIVTAETETKVEGYIVDTRHNDNKMTWTINKEKLNKVIRTPFGQSTEHISLYAYTLDEAQIPELKRLLVAEMQMIIQEEKNRVIEAEHVVNDFADKVSY